MQTKEIAERYVAVWNEPDAEARRKKIAEVWAEDGVQLLYPPQEVREAAERLGTAASLEARGHAALEERVARSYEEFVAPGGFAFRAGDDAQRLGDVVKFSWHMVNGAGEPAGGGLEVVVLDADGRIREDYQFI
ncbi:hypothetical protein [Actinomadura sp. 21ATH]|uniref:hypothetical protein n=1 Tax=Actinomadura sp. 21ATH TaxID=1735444 RepID=UPI0035C17B08